MSVFKDFMNGVQSIDKRWLKNTSIIAGIFLMVMLVGHTILMTLFYLFGIWGGVGMLFVMLFGMFFFSMVERSRQ